MAKDHDINSLGTKMSENGMDENDREGSNANSSRLPNGWEWKSVAQIARVDAEVTDPRVQMRDKQFAYIDISGVEAGTGRIKEARLILGKDAPSRARRVVHTNDVLMSTVRPNLKSFALVPKEYDGQVCSTGFAVLTCREGTLPKFLLHCLSSDIVIQQCHDMMKGGHYPALTSTQVSRIKIPHPPLEEQTRIVAKIDEIGSTLERARSLREQAIGEVRALMESVLALTFSRQEDRAWKLMKLEEIGTVSSGGTPDRTVKEYFGGNISWFKAKELGDSYLTTSEETLSEKGLENSPAKLLPIGAVIIGMYDTAAGKLGILSFEGATNQACAALEPNARIDPKYCFYALKFGRRDLVEGRRGIRQQNLNLEMIKHFRIPIPIDEDEPSIEKQRRIASYLDNLHERFEQVVGQQNDTKKDLGSLEEAVLRKALTGKL